MNDKPVVQKRDVTGCGACLECDARDGSLDDELRRASRYLAVFESFEGWFFEDKSRARLGDGSSGFQCGLQSRYEVVTQENKIVQQCEKRQRESRAGRSGRRESPVCAR